MTEHKIESGLITMNDIILDQDFFGRLLYVFLCTFPYMMLVLHSFRGRWRLRKPAMICLVISAVTFQLATLPIRIYFSKTIPYQIFDVLNSAVYVTFIFAAIKEHIGKLVFTVLVLTDLGTFVVISAKCLEGIFFPEQALLRYYYTYHLFIVLVLAAVLPLIYLLVFRNISSPPEGYRQGALAEQEKANGYMWRYLWLVPAVFYLIWLQHFYAGGTWDLATSMDPTSTLYLFAIDAGSVLIYRIIVKTAWLYERNTALLGENHELSIQRLQYESLNARLENMRRTRHDIRHHTALLKQIRDSGDLSELDELIEMYTEQNILDRPLIYCANETVNIVLALYSETAYNNNISFSVKADIPEDIFAEKSDLAVMFGNILENASDACREVNGERFIDLTAAYSTSPNGTQSLTLIVRNSCGTAPHANENGIFRSTKHPGDGIGISSVKSITEKYGGACSFTSGSGVFTVSVILYHQ